MALSYFSRVSKRKRIVVEEEYEVFLNISVFHAEGIDEEIMNKPCGDRRIYKVFGWVIPGQEFCTPEVEGLPDPTWKRGFQIPLGKHMLGRVLNLEVVRTRTESDPGTSTRIALVGRTQIPLPKDFDTQKSGRFGLVRPLGSGGHIPEGHIAVTMEMKKIDHMHMKYYYYF